MKNLKNNIMSALEKFSKIMVQPLMYLAAAGLVMVIGILITNQSITDVLPFLTWMPIRLFGTLVYQSVMAIINNLNILFCVGIAGVVAKKNKQHAVIIAILSMLMFLTANNIVLKEFDMLAQPQGMVGLVGTGQASILGIQALDMGVFSGIILGFITGIVFNKTSNKTFKQTYLQMFTGVKWSLVWMIFVSILFGFAVTFVWPPVQNAINSVAGVILNTGNFGLFLFGFLERLLIPTGLHHLVGTPFLFTSLGGTLQLGENVIQGAYPILATQMNMPGLVEFSDAIKWNFFGFTKTFGYIGIAMAFIKTAYPQNKARVKAILIPLAFTTFLVGITEPIDFMFVFVAPLLYFIHAIIAGASMVALYVLGFRGGTAGLSSIIMNIALGKELTNWPVFIILAIAQILLYYFVFTFLIKKLNLKTPGREKEEKKETDNKTVSVDAQEGIVSVVEGLGGKENITNVENCFTRLRVKVANPELVNKDIINKHKNNGIVEKGNDIQIIYGLQVSTVAKQLKDYLGID